MVSAVGVAATVAVGGGSGVAVAPTSVVAVGNSSGVVASVTAGAPGVIASVAGAAGVASGAAMRSSPTKPGAASTIPAPSRMPSSRPTSAHSHAGAPAFGARRWGRRGFGWRGRGRRRRLDAQRLGHVVVAFGGGSPPGATRADGAGVTRLAGTGAATLAGDAAAGCAAPRGCPQWRQKRVSALTSLPQLGQSIAPADDADVAGDAGAGTGAGVAGEAATAEGLKMWPHLLQKRAPARLKLPQFGQTCCSSAIVLTPSTSIKSRVMKNCPGNCSAACSRTLLPMPERVATSRHLLAPHPNFCVSLRVS
jgi:hypothetical protein